MRTRTVHLPLVLQMHVLPSILLFTLAQEALIMMLDFTNVSSAFVHGFNLTISSVVLGNELFCSPFRIYSYQLNGW